MTGYHISLGYNGATRTDYDAMWEILKQRAREVCDNPQAIVAEARRLGAPESCTRGCCHLDTYADNYAEPFEAFGHPVTIITELFKSIRASHRAKNPKRDSGYC